MELRELIVSIINGLIQIGILVVLAKTLYKISDQIKIQNNQLEIQNNQIKIQNTQLDMQHKLLNAQLLRDRLETYWKTYEPVTDNDLKEFNLLIEDYMDIKKYEEYYKNDNDSIRRYISLLAVYEYLAFTYALKTLNLPDPLGPKWTEQWAKDLYNDYKEFRDIHEYHKDFYPDFKNFINKEFDIKEYT